MEEWPGGFEDGARLCALSEVFYLLGFIMVCVVIVFNNSFYIVTTVFKN